MEFCLAVIVVSCEDFPQCSHITGLRLATFIGKLVY